MGFRTIQLTNTSIGAVASVAAGTLVPLGTITRKYCCGNCGQSTFTVSTSGANTVTLNEAGYYLINYSASVVAGAAGLVTLNLVQNGTVLYSVSETAAAAGDTVNLSLPYMVRVLPNCCSSSANLPATIQITSSGVALTGGTSNILVEKVH